MNQKLTEIILTYGWILLVGISIVAVLVMLGFLDPRTGCSIEGFKCVSYSAQGTDFSITLISDMRFPVNITDADIGCGKSSALITPTAEVNPGDSFKIDVICPQDIQRIDKITIQYIDETGYQHPATGTIQ